MALDPNDPNTPPPVSGPNANQSLRGMTSPEVTPQSIPPGSVTQRPNFTGAGADPSVGSTAVSTNVAPPSAGPTAAPRATPGADFSPPGGGGATIEEPRVSSPYSAGLRAGQGVSKIAGAIGDFVKSPMGQFAGNTLRAAGGIYGGVNAVSDFQNGDYASGAAHSADALASVAAGPIGAAWGAGRILGAGANALMPETMKDSIGQTIAGALGTDPNPGFDPAGYENFNKPGAAPSLRPTPAAAIPPPVSDLHRGGNTAPGAPAPAANPAGTITKDGNSFSGNNIGAGANMQDANGNPVSFRNPVGFISTPGSHYGAAQMLADAEGIRQNGLRAQQINDVNYISPGAGVIQASDRDAHNASVQSIIPTSFRGGGMMGSGNSGPSIHRQQMANEMQLGMARIASEGRGQDLSHSDRQDEVQAQIFGHKLTNQANMSRLGYEIGKDNRDAGLRQQEADQTEKNAGQAAWQKGTEAFFPGADGKPDAAKIADYNSTVTNTLGNMQKELSASNDPADRAKADRLGKLGPAGLDENDRAAFQRNYLRMQLHKQTYGNSPLASKGTLSNDLRDYAGMRTQQGNLVQPRQEFFNPKSGKVTGSVPNVNVDYGADANHILPNWGQPSNSLRTQ